MFSFGSSLVRLWTNIKPHNVSIYHFSDKATYTIWQQTLKLPVYNIVRKTHIFLNYIIVNLREKCYTKILQKYAFFIVQFTSEQMFFLLYTFYIFSIIIYFIQIVYIFQAANSLRPYIKAYATHKGLVSECLPYHFWLRKFTAFGRLALPVVPNLFIFYGFYLSTVEF